MREVRAFGGSAAVVLATLSFTAQPSSPAVPAAQSQPPPGGREPQPAVSSPPTSFVSGATAAKAGSAAKHAAGHPGPGPLGGLAWQRSEQEVLQPSGPRPRSGDGSGGRPSVPAPSVTPSVRLGAGQKVGGTG